MIRSHNKGSGHIKLKLGKRNIKTAAAVTLSVLVSQFFKLGYPFFTVIAALFTMENSFSSSYKAGVYRIIGTLVGALTGYAFIFIQPGNALLVGIGTLILIFICNTFKWDRAVPIAGVMFAAIMLSMNDKNPLLYILSRILNTFVGIVIAVAINYLVYPPNNLNELRKNLLAIEKKLSDAISEYICLGKNVDLGSLRKEVIDSIKFLENYRMEFSIKADSDTAYSGASMELDLLRDILSHLRTLNELGIRCGLTPENLEKLMLLDICDAKLEAFSGSDESIIYNYHIGRILDALPGLKHIPG